MAALLGCLSWEQPSYCFVFVPYFDGGWFACTFWCFDLASERGPIIFGFCWLGGFIYLINFKSTWPPYFLLYHYCPRLILFGQVLPSPRAHPCVFLQFPAHICGVCAVTDHALCCRCVGVAREFYAGAPGSSTASSVSSSA